jgi:DNA-binding GntR family transcriptional regulator
MLDAEQPYRTLAERVREDIRNEILAGGYRPGQRIGQEALARRHGTSRIPIREALRQLASEGLVVLQPHVGARVATLDLRELDEVYQIREQVEPFAIGKSAPLLTDADLEALRAFVEQMEVAALNDEVSRWIELDRDFHLRTFVATPLPRLLALIDGLWNTTQQYRRLYGLLPNRLEIAGVEHRLLLDALERRDSDDATRILTMHIRRTRLTLDEHADLFD